MASYASGVKPFRLKITPRNDMVFGLRLSSVIGRRACLKPPITVYAGASDSRDSDIRAQSQAITRKWL